MTDVEKLLQKIGEITSYPSGKMEEVKAGIKGLAFFPGGRGLYDDNDQTISNKEIMILGQDFDTKEKYESAKRVGKENPEKNKTWKNLCTFLQHTEIKIDLNNCFFTNALMGVRLVGSASGPSPGFDNKEFEKDCQRFFLFNYSYRNP